MGFPDFIQVGSVDEEFHKDSSIYHISSRPAALKALQAPLRAEKIVPAVFVNLQRFFLGDKGLAHRVLNQHIRLPGLGALGRRTAQTQGLAHRPVDPVSQVSQGQCQQ
jgi:hypothetical protein